MIDLQHIHEGLNEERGKKMKKDKKYQTVDITTTLEVVDNSFAYKSKEDIDQLCTVLKAQAENGSDIQGYIYINRMGKRLSSK